MTNAEALLRKGKPGAAAFVQAECMANKASQVNQSSSGDEVPQTPVHLEALLNYLLNPRRDIADEETIDWCKWLVGGGQKPEDFCSKVQEYNNTKMCGLVWTANFVAYRCSTCRISQCMSLCRDCFHSGNHIAEGHDYNMFKSQAGGACDCGDESVMRTSGFCVKHGSNSNNSKENSLVPPAELMCVAENMLPKMILRLVQHLREKSVSSPADSQGGGPSSSRQVSLDDAEKFLSLLHEFCDMGSAMRAVIITCLISNKIYTHLTRDVLNSGQDSEYVSFMRKSTEKYRNALAGLPGPEPPTKYCECPVLSAELVHNSFLEELLFWTVRYEFPQKLVCLLLNMLPDQQYKHLFTRAFVVHYSRMSTLLDKSGIYDTLSNRVIHVSVQLFSNEALALKMTESLHLLHMIVFSIKNMMSSVLTLNTLGDVQQNYHEVVDCGEHVMKDHCYWPLVSDLNNILSHPSVSYKFMEDEKQLAMWFDFLPMFQGMNVNTREMRNHIEFEPNTYYASFSAELETSASPMWSLVSHLKDASTRHLTLNVIHHCLRAIKQWFDAIYFLSPDQLDRFKMSFHLPLHRYYAVFLRQAVKYQGFQLDELLPDPRTLHLMMMHPLSVQVAFHEIIMTQMWVRNGLQIRGQAMTYIQCHFANSMVDPDLFLLQICATRLDPSVFLKTIIDRFNVKQWLSLGKNKRKESSDTLEQENEIPMMESMLFFLVSLLTLRTNLGLSDLELTRLEIITLLCIEDRTHSTLTEAMPEKNGNGVSDDFETVLSEVGSFREPQFEAGGVMQQGMYVPKPEVWETMYDPIYVLLRGVHRRNFQNSFDRFIDYVQRYGKLNTCSGEKIGTPFLPWRLPPPCDESFTDPRVILHSRFSHGLIFNMLYKAVYGEGENKGEGTNEQILSLTIFLLELALSYPQKNYSGKELAVSTPWLIVHEPVDLDYDTWFPTNWLSANLRHTVTAIFTNKLSSNDRPGDGSGAESMEVDQISDSGSNVGSDSTPYFVETPSSDINEASSPPTFREHQQPPMPLTAGSPVANESSSRALLLYPEGVVAPILSVCPVDQQEASASSSDARLPAAIDHMPGSSAHEQNLLVHIDNDGVMSQDESVFLGQQPQIGSKAMVNINESIISLLIKLHSKLSGKPDSYIPKNERAKIPKLAHSVTQDYQESRIGDACFFIEKVLDKIYELDSSCEHSIKVTRTHLWPNQHASEAAEDIEQERNEAEARRRKAQERKEKIMREFAERQQRFMKQTKENENISDPNFDIQPKTVLKLYDCVHCHQAQPSTPDRPMGLVVLLQASSVLGHQHKDNNHLNLPVTEEELRNKQERQEDSLGTTSMLRDKLLASSFDQKSFLSSVNIGWRGGVFVESCGHYVHLACQHSYMQSLRGMNAAQINVTIAAERGEYMCPMCRQLANGVLPILPDQVGQIVQATSEYPVDIGHEITSILMEPAMEAISNNSPIMIAMNRIMESLTQTYYNHKLVSSEYAIMLFIGSVARTNLELNLISRGGSLLTATNVTASPVPTSSRPRDYILPLLHMLGVHAKRRLPKPLVSEWCQISGLWKEELDPCNLMVRENDVPMLLRDPVALLINFVLALPMQIDPIYFVCLVRQLYNLCWMQACLKVAVLLPQAVRQKLHDDWDANVKQNTDPHRYLKVDTVTSAIGLLSSCLASTGLFHDQPDAQLTETAAAQRITNPTSITMDELEQRVQIECLNFMRIASLMRHYTYEDTIPDVWEPDWEFTRLAQYLGMADVDISGRVSSGPCLGWLTAPANLCYNWTRQLYASAGKSLISIKKLVMMNTLWKQPQLLRLPKNYDAIFQFYYKRECRSCNSVPKDPSICLLCGTMVCLRESCCKSPSEDAADRFEHEAVKHSLVCNAGTAPFLAVNSATIIVIRGKRACVWGSIYLDSFGEEDKELKRGKPLFLSMERYHFLESQWLTHRFDHTNRKWIWHRDSL